VVLNIMIAWARTLFSVSIPNRDYRLFRAGKASKLPQFLIASLFQSLIGIIGYFEKFGGFDVNRKY
jgi:hypothetical protein